jgi:hypothetical protein
MDFVADGLNEKQMENFEVEIYGWIKKYKQMHKNL